MRRLSDEQNRNSNPVGYDHLEPIAEDHVRNWPAEQQARYHQELRQLSQEPTPPPNGADHGFVPVSLSTKNERDIGTVDRCPRSIRRFIEAENSTLAVWLPCDSRTCRYCKDSIDERDAGRIAHSLADAETIYHARVPVESWERIRKRAQRAGAVAMKMGSNAAVDMIEVVASSPIIEKARPVSMGQVVEMVNHRPTGSPPIGEWEKGEGKTRGRVAIHTTGVGLVTVREWEEIKAKPTARSVGMHHTITVDDIRDAATVLNIPYRIEGPHGLRLAVPWDDPRMVGIRHWARNPQGSTGTWEHMLLETEIAQGVLLEEPPPIEVYEKEAAA